MGRHNDLFFYTEDQVSRALVKAGYGAFEFDQIERNGDGTALRFECYRSCAKPRVLSFRIDGRISLHLAPARDAHINDDCEFVAWPAEEKRGVRFADGSFVEVPELGMFSSFGVDPAGKYFFISDSIGGRRIETIREGGYETELVIPNYYASVRSTRVGRVRQPKDVLFRLPNFYATKVFSVRNRVFLFDENDEKVILCLVFLDSGSTLSFEDVIPIPIPRTLIPLLLVVNDLDLRGEWVLLTGVSDWHVLPHRRFLFNLKTREIKEVSSPWGTYWGFFLAGDIIGSLPDRQKARIPYEHDEPVPR